MNLIELVQLKVTRLGVKRYKDTENNEKKSNTNPDCTVIF
jgi:hypothetical protein